MFDTPFETLKHDLFKRPSPSLIYAARWMAASFPRDILPDWVEALANGNIEYWADVCEIARIDVNARSDKKTTVGASGHSTVSFGALIGVLAALALGIFALLATATPQLAHALDSITVDTDTSHAVQKHGAAVITIDNCFDTNGVWQEWTNPANGRHARVCKLDSGKYGIQILSQDENGIWHEITKFVKEKMNTWDQVAQYLKNSGYEPH